jgi:glutathione S-transferase
VELPPILHRPLVRALRFPGHRVPALLLDGRRIQGSRAITRAVGGLYPDDPTERAEVEAAERWGEEELQPILRWIQPWALLRRRDAIPSLVQDLALPVPPSVQAALVIPSVRLAAQRNPSNDETVRVALTRLPALLDRVDGWIADGVLGGDRANAADVQIVSTLRMLMVYDDLAPALDARPAGALARRLLPDVPGRVPPVFPAELVPG